MISKNTLKFIKSLQQKKFRRLEQAFFVEGSKNVTELLLSDFEVTHLLYTSKFQEEYAPLIARSRGENYEVSAKELEAAGSFKTNDGALAVAKIKKNSIIDLHEDELALALDDVRDPGNLGTIIRIADWYGIKKVLCSQETADFYNPKVLNASMGSFTRVECCYTDLEEFLARQNVPIYGTFLDGASIYAQTDLAQGVILMGNESKGISSKLERLVTKKLTIPRFGEAESLNVAIATAVVCDNFRRGT